MNEAPPIVHLENGMPVLLRLITEADREVVQEAFRRLSPDSRYSRLWSTQKSLPDSLLNRFLNAQPGQHETWAAQHPEAPAEPGSGGASFWRDETDPGRAEISLTVADECQHTGVGTLLLAVLWRRAEATGIEEFVGCVLPENYAMLDWLRSLGAALKLEGGQFSFRLPLDASRLKASPAAEKLQRRLSEIVTLPGIGAPPEF